MIKARNLSLSISGKPLVQDLSFALAKGAFTAIIGPNGAGKSTLLSLMGRLVAPTKGEVRLQGTPLTELNSQRLAQRLSILRQTNEIIPRLTVEDLVSLGRYPHSQGRLGPIDQQQVALAMQRLHLVPIRNRLLDTLSGGQRQRALLAMCLAQQTEVILLDEPLNNLDLAHARSVMALCREDAAAGKTVAAVLHDLTAAAVHADEIIALKDGRLHSKGTAQEVITPDNLSDLYDAPISVEEIKGQRVVLTI